ncbi:MAG: hypothetical protein IJM21_00680 [Clostridia bacterium]|nr:hypothetical protein [Clostridia bacterium]
MRFGLDGSDVPRVFPQRETADAAPDRRGVGRIGELPEAMTAEQEKVIRTEAAAARTV